ERYGSGNKARKFYETACDFYERAHNKDKKDFSCLYNWARVTYILATFTKPAYSSQKRLNLLQLSIERFKNALIIDPYALDAMFNLKQALSNFGEICLDEVSSTTALLLYREACELGEKLFKLQEEVYIREKNEENQQNNNENNDMDIENANDDQDNEQEKNPNPTIMEKEEIYGEKGENVTINTLIETLTTNAEDLNNLSSLTYDPIESQNLFNQALESLQKAEHLVQEYLKEKIIQKNKDITTNTKSKSNKNNTKNNEEENMDVEVDLTIIDSTYATILSNRGEHLFNSMDIFDAMFFEKALEHQNKVIQRITPEKSNSLVIYHQKAKELCNKGDILCSFAEVLINNGESIDEHSPSQEMYREALSIYEKALAYEESNNSIICKIGDMNLILASNYLLLSQNKHDDAYQSMLKHIRKSLDIYKIALKNNFEQPVKPEIYLRVAKGLSYYDDLTSHCQRMLQKFIEMEDSLEILENDHQFVNFDFSNDIKNAPWFIKTMKQLQ
ncbi:hypothetical protein PIROE2DRAFT_19342, partial [Piromyces sp. E2]